MRTCDYVWVREFPGDLPDQQYPEHICEKPKHHAGRHVCQCGAHAGDINPTR